MREIILVSHSSEWTIGDLVELRCNLADAVYYAGQLIAAAKRDDRQDGVEWTRALRSAIDLAEVPLHQMGAQMFQGIYPYPPKLILWPPADEMGPELTPSLDRSAIRASSYHWLGFRVAEAVYVGMMQEATGYVHGDVEPHVIWGTSPDILLEKVSWGYAACFLTTGAPIFDPDDLSAMIEDEHRRASDRYFATQKTAPSPTPVPSELTADEQAARGLVAMMGDDDMRILAIASDGTKTADQRMREIVRLDRRAIGWQSSRWAEVLRVSAAAIRQTDFWKVDRKEAMKPD